MKVLLFSCKCKCFKSFFFWNSKTKITQMYEYLHTRKQLYVISHTHSSSSFFFSSFSFSSLHYYASQGTTQAFIGFCVAIWHHFLANNTNDKNKKRKILLHMFILLLISSLKLVFIHLVTYSLTYLIISLTLKLIFKEKSICRGLCL